MKKNITYTTHGAKHTNPKDNTASYTKMPFNEKNFYKDDEAFASGNGVCYIPDKNDYQYTREDLLAMCANNTAFTEFIYGLLAGETPRELIDSVSFQPHDIERLHLNPFKVENLYLLPQPERGTITDSLLLPSGVEVLSGRIRNITVSIVTQGHVNISWKEENYRLRQDFPDDLVEVIRAGKLGEHPDAEVLENNWYEMIVYVDGKVVHSDVIDMDLNDETPFTAKAFIRDTANDFLKPQKGDIIRITKMDDKNGTDWQAKSMNGAIGYVRLVDSAGQLHGSWGGLAILPEIDHFMKL